MVAEGKKGGIEVLFLGDSITHFWRENPFSRESHGQATWDKHLAPLKAATFGLAGDKTQNLLWRLRNGVLAALKPHPPKVVVLMIGTNNHGDSAADVAAGVGKISEEIRAAWPATKVLLLGIFPRGQPQDALRAKNDKTNELLAKLHDGKAVRFLEIGAKFLGADRRISSEIMYDSLHLSAKGYALWAEAILPSLKELLEGEGR